MFLLFAVLVVFILQLDDVRGWRYISNSNHNHKKRIQLPSMVAGKGFEKTHEVEISLDDTTHVAQSEQDLTGCVHYFGYIFWL